MICLANHKEGAEILLDYTAGTLDPARRVEVDRHSRNCAQCRQLIEAQRTVFSALDEFTAPSVSAGFDQKLYARIAKERPSFWRQFLPAAPIAWWKPAVPVALAAAALTVMFTLHTSHAPVAQKQPGIGSAVNIEQVEQALDDMDLLAPAAPSSSSSVM